MSKKPVIAGLLLAAAATLSVPMAASAAPYTGGGGCSISPSTMATGGSATMNCGPGTWTPGTPITYGGTNGGTVTGNPTDPANGTGGSSITVSVPSDPGQYTFTARDTAGATESATVTVIPASAAATSVDSSTLAHTGEDVSPWVAGAGAGLLAIGAALVGGVWISRRRHANS